MRPSACSLISVRAGAEKSRADCCQKSVMLWFLWIGLMDSGALVRWKPLWLPMLSARNCGGRR